jgi:hypothetical protein
MGVARAARVQTRGCKREVCLFCLRLAFMIAPRAYPDVLARGTAAHSAVLASPFVSQRRSGQGGALRPVTGLAWGRLPYPAQPWWGRPFTPARNAPWQAPGSASRAGLRPEPSHGPQSPWVSKAPRPRLCSAPRLGWRLSLPRICLASLKRPQDCCQLDNPGGRDIVFFAGIRAGNSCKGGGMQRGSTQGREEEP